jgi:hypothetical protein
MASLPRWRWLWGVAGAVALAAVVFGYLLGGSRWEKTEDTPDHRDQSFTLSGKQASDKVENGRAYDRALIIVEGQTGVVVPSDARIEQGAAHGRIEVYLEKSLDYWGHPHRFMSIREERKAMGCASRSDAHQLAIATWGEWNDDLEGGAQMKVLIRVPPGLRIEARKGLSGPIIIGPRGSGGSPRTKVTPGKDGWKAISDEPDPRHTAKSNYTSRGAE